MSRDEDHALYLRWLEKRKEHEAEQRKKELQRVDRLTHDIEARLAGVRGKYGDDGNGKCKWCGIVLGRSKEGHVTHPNVRECSGPPPVNCPNCGNGYTKSSSGRWVHECRAIRETGPRAQQLERVRVGGTPGDGKQGVFGFRREVEE